ncbi:copper transporter [Laccaria bicolor S238N-H82]|uniref:Copper transporter n=1 Tax=Laccaria bicolor (strain S238N-H82 / ATCC MYA-4686) TaxID=486041 RepID=B0CRM3_LACBS|nr:copper transporter [Laccaria bicolor S238N-H82]EDR15230.1 copper transporter [Laccaria bicolor S238N-H82]|eukprot:XP_001873438.1 copper transporter [Laccaria bicolor S238N-H82]
MDNWQSLQLHWTFRGQHVLFSSIALHSFSSFSTAALVVSIICLLERFLSFSLDKRLGPGILKRSRWLSALWRTAIYWIATFLRLMYMLAAMTFHLGIIFVIVTTLAAAQLAIELQNTPNTLRSRDFSDVMSQPLLQEHPYPLKPVRTRQNSRSKSKPDDIFIHPAQSNLARADAAALELGISVGTERVHANIYEREEAAWEVGQGKDMARELLLGQKRKNQPSFQVGSDSDLESPSE